MKIDIPKLKVRIDQVVDQALFSQWGYQSRSNLGTHRVFVEGSPKVITPLCSREPWIDFRVDELRCGSWFRVTYSIFLSRSGWGREIFCSSPAGLSLETYGWERGKMPVVQPIAS